MTETYVETIFGDRVVVFVKYPIEWTGGEVITKLNWAKWHQVVELYDGFLIKCGIKPHYLEHFKEQNKEFIVPHSHMIFEEGTEDEYESWEVEGSIYE